MKYNRKKQQDIIKRRQLRIALLIMAMLFTVMAAGCSEKPSEEDGVPTGTAFTPSGTGGYVTFTGNIGEISEAGVGDTVRFGSYEQDNDTSNGAEAIEWLVLDKQDGKLLLLSKNALECKKYNEESVKVTWETCTLRDWLNSTFYTTAFSTVEQERIETTKVRNEDNTKYWRTRGGNDTEDKVFLLSIREAKSYFDSFSARCTKVTAYAKAQGASANNEGNGWWWLRSPGISGRNAAFINITSSYVVSGSRIDREGGSVRPAFWLNPESASPVSTPEPTPSGTAFTPSGTGGSVTFTGNTVEISKANVGDTVRFGSYEQDNDTSNGAEAIEWLVLDKQDGKLLLLSKYVLDAKPYNEEWVDVTWETCTLRSWLNSTFCTTVFSKAEQGRIATAKVKNGDNPEYGTEGETTEDKVFLLSIGEAMRYFDPDLEIDDPARRAKVTAYAEAQDAYVNSAGIGWWGLRSPGRDNRAAGVYGDGYLRMSGYGVGNGDGGVRPAFWLNPDS